MARDYEVRDEYKNYGLSQLMDAPVLCFQGVGDIQAELLKQYFRITTVRDLANWTQFLWALEIQELALNAGDLAHTPIKDFAGDAPPKFKVRERSNSLTPEQLMLAGVQDLDGLTPAQDLALYDIFRITNIAQLAHNRIMLEARVIQYLESQSGAGGEAAAGEGVDQVLGRPAVSVATAASSAAQRITEGRRAGRDERLHAMASDTREHVRERISAVRERARVRAAAPGAQPSRADVMAGVQRTAPSERLASMASRRTTVAGSATRERGAVIDQGRTLGRAGGELATRVAGVGAAGGSRTAAVLAARGERTAGAPEPARAGRPAGAGSGGGGTSPVGAARTGQPSAGLAAATGAAAAPSVAGAPPASAQAPSGAAGQPQRRIPPVLYVAAVVIVAASGVAYYALRPADRTGTGGPATTGQTGSVAAPGGAGQPGSTSAPGSQGAAVAPGKPGTSGAPGTATAPATSQRPAVQGSSAPGSAKTIHTVRRGQSLWRISRRYYQVGHEWPAIYQDNKSQIREPNLIYPQQQFTIPPKP